MNRVTTMGLLLASLCAAPAVAQVRPPATRARAARTATARDASLAPAPAPADPLLILLTRGVATEDEARAPFRSYPYFDTLTAGDSVVRTSVPPALAAAIEAAAPSWRLRYPGPFNGGYPMQLVAPGFRIATPDAVVADLDSDGRLEAVLVGWLMAAGRPIVDSAMDEKHYYLTGDVVRLERHGTMLPVVVLGIRTSRDSAGAVRWEVTSLGRDSAAVFDRDDRFAQSDGFKAHPFLRPFATSDAGGQETLSELASKRALRRSHRFVRYGDDDCTTAGGQWTVRAGRWVRVPAVCTIED